MTTTVDTVPAGSASILRIHGDITGDLTDAANIGLLPGTGDEYVVTSGGLQGQRGFFTRVAGGAVVGVDLAGRLFKRTRTTAE